jgi:hypothetical protein
MSPAKICHRDKVVHASFLQVHFFMCHGLTPRSKQIVTKGRKTGTLGGWGFPLPQIEFMFTPSPHEVVLKSSDRRPCFELDP